MRHSMIIFWTVLLAIILSSLLLAYLLANGEGVFMLSITGPIYVYFSIYGFLIVKNWLPFMIKIGATRKNIFVSFALYFTSLAFIFSFFGMILHTILTPVELDSNVHIFFCAHLAHFLYAALYVIVFIDIIFCLFLFVTSFFIGLINYRYGLLVSGSFIGFIILIGILGLYHGWLIDFFKYIYTNFDLLLFTKVGIVSIIIYFITLLILRNSKTIRVRYKK